DLVEYILLLLVVGAAWAVALAINDRRVRACDGSGNPEQDIVVFVEALRWLFIVWGFPRFCRGLRRGGCQQQVRLFRWSGSAGALLVLPDYLCRHRLLTKARRLARFLDELAERHPGRTIHLVGYSTGGFLVLEALKRLRHPVPVGEVILLAGALSPYYHTHELSDRARRVHNFYSYRDFLISGLAPLVFGSNDGRRGLACGMVGFRPQHSASRPEFVIQHPWSTSAIRLGYFGDHFSITSSAFVARRIAPLVAGPSDLSTATGDT
ncbi:unnamed protein product, partial [marine sediment metagenome]